jgi:MFS family permease
VRRLLVTVSAVVLVDMMLYSVLTPLLPQIVDELNLGKGTAGLLVAAYAAGALVGAFPASYLTTRLGPKQAVVTGLTLLVAASIVFATADSLRGLMAARVLQGVSSSISWTGGIGWLLASAPRERRGELLGVALGTGIFGAVFGPVLGSLAAVTSRQVVFAGVAALAFVAAVFTLRLESAPAVGATRGALRRALRNSTFLAGLGLMLLPAFLGGILQLLAPLHLSSRGWSAVAVGAVWLVGAVTQAGVTPILGRFSDRRGPLGPTASLLAVGGLLSALLSITGAPLLYAVVLLVTSSAYVGLFAPAFALIAQGAEQSGLAQGVAFAGMNAAWSVGAIAGPAAGGAVAEAAGDGLPLLVASGVCAVTLVFVASRRRPRPALA